MIIKVKKDWRDAIEERPDHNAALGSRRRFLRNTALTGAVSMLLPKAFMGGLVKDAMADVTGTASGSGCPAPTRAKGAIAQIYAEGGPTMGARFLTDEQVQGMGTMGSTMAARYGVTGQADIVNIGPNLNVSKTSPFGAAILAGAPGYTQVEWMAVLRKVSLGAVHGPFNLDDGAGSDSGLLGGVANFKPSMLHKDLRINNNNALAPWANGQPSSKVSGAPSVASMSKAFTMTPANKINLATMQASATATQQLSSIFGPLFGQDKRKGAGGALSSAVCGFLGDASLADPTFGASLFDPTKIPDLNSKLMLAQLSMQEQALLSSFYRSADGTAGGVMIEFGGRDYHGDTNTNIGNRDFEDGRTIVMFIAACEQAQSKGSLMYVSNGQAIANGVLGATMVGGNGQGFSDGATAAISVQPPSAQGDAGGAYNAGLIICYDPKGSPPTLKSLGKIDPSNGNATADPAAASGGDGLASLYLTALTHIGMGVQDATNAIQSAGLAAVPSKLLLMS